MLFRAVVERFGPVDLVSNEKGIKIDGEQRK